MKFSKRFTDVVEVLSASVIDDGYGGTVEDWGDPSRRRVEGVFVFAARALETPTGPEPYLASDELTAILPYGDPVQKLDKVEVLTGPYAGTYEVDGRPAHWRTPWSGWEGGCEVVLKGVSGG